MRHVDANLMSAAGFEVAVDQRGECGGVRRLVKTFQHFVMRNGLVGVLIVRTLDGASGPVASGAAERRVDGADQLARAAPDDRLVGAFQRRGAAVVGELLGQMAMGDIVLSDDHDAGGVLVQPVDDAGSAYAADAGEAVAAMMDQRVDQRARPVAGGGVNHEAGRLGDDDDVVVLVEHIERNVFALRRRVFGFGQGDLDRYRPGAPCAWRR